MHQAGQGSGRDQPGVIARLMGILDEACAEMCDVEQLVIWGRLDDPPGSRRPVAGDGLREAGYGRLVTGGWLQEAGEQGPGAGGLVGVGPELKG